MTRQVIQSLSYLISHCTNAYYRSDNDSDKNNDEDGDEDDANANADGERGDALLLDDDSTS